MPELVLGGHVCAPLDVSSTLGSSSLTWLFYKIFWNQKQFTNSGLKHNCFYLTSHLWSGQQELIIFSTKTSCFMQLRSIQLWKLQLNQLWPATYHNITPFGLTADTLIFNLIYHFLALYPTLHESHSPFQSLPLRKHTWSWSGAIWGMTYWGERACQAFSHFPQISAPNVAHEIFQGEKMKSWEEGKAGTVEWQESRGRSVNRNACMHE